MPLVEANRCAVHPAARQHGRHSFFFATGSLSSLADRNSCLKNPFFLLAFLVDLSPLSLLCAAFKRKYGGIRIHAAQGIIANNLGGYLTERNAITPKAKRKNGVGLFWYGADVG